MTATASLLSIPNAPISGPLKYLWQTAIHVRINESLNMQGSAFLRFTEQPGSRGMEFFDAS